MVVSDNMSFMWHNRHSICKYESCFPGNNIIQNSFILKHMCQIISIWCISSWSSTQVC